MSEKRFELLLPNAIINDTVVRKSYYLSEKEDVEKFVALLNELTEENKQLKSLVNACEYGQKSLMEEMKYNDEALDKIWEIMKELYGVIDDE